MPRSFRSPRYTHMCTHKQWIFKWGKSINHKLNEMKFKTKIKLRARTRQKSLAWNDVMYGGYLLVHISALSNEHENQLTRLGTLYFWQLLFSSQGWVDFDADSFSHSIVGSRRSFRLSSAWLVQLSPETPKTNANGTAK